MISLLILISMAVVLLTSMTAATVYISESNQAGEVVTDNISNINFGSIDQPNIVAANHPIIQGNASYFKMLRVKVQNLGTSTTIQDLRYWKSAGAYVVGESIFRFDGGISAGAVAAYVAPSQAAQANPPFLGAGNLILTSDPGSANIGIAGSLVKNFPSDVAVPGYSTYFTLQLVTTGATPVGAVNQKTITFQYSET